MDRETLSKLLKEGLLIDTEDGYRPPQAYDELSEAYHRGCDCEEQQSAKIELGHR